MEKLDLGLPSYMGRGIIAGFTADYKPAVIYFAQGRSSTSRMRKLVALPDEGIVKMEPNSETSIEEMIESGGNPNLLLYNAIRGGRDGLLVVSNGFQTDCDPIWEGEGREKENLKGAKLGGGIYYRIKRGYAKYCLSNPEKLIHEAICESLTESGSEVDSIRTARIASAIDTERNPDFHYMGIVVRKRNLHDPSKFSTADNLGVIHNRRLKTVKGKFIMIATYGVNNPPYHAALPPDVSPMDSWRKGINLEGLTPDELAEEVWTGLPKELMVGVASAMRDESQPNGFSFAVRNMKG